MKDAQPSYRLMNLSDVDFVLSLASAEAWTTSRRWIEALIEHDPQGCLVAEIEDVRAGTVTATHHGSTGWIGYLIVVPPFRNAGLGRALMGRAIHYLEACGARTVRLDADPPGVRLYRSLGFVDEYVSRRFRFAGSPPVSGPEVLPMTSVEDAAPFDLPRFGDDRSRMLRLLLRQSEAAFHLKTEGGMTGYAMLSPTTTGVHLGPCVATEGATASLLIEAALFVGQGRAMTLGIPVTNPAGLYLLRRLSFEETVSSIRMFRGERQGAGLPENIFAIAHGAIG
jgi:GNAT superfamily N-acetyltransferase